MFIPVLLGLTSSIISNFVWASLGAAGAASVPALTLTEEKKKRHKKYRCLKCLNSRKIIVYLD